MRIPGRKRSLNPDYVGNRAGVFAEAVRTGDMELAWSMLSKETCGMRLGVWAKWRGKQYAIIGGRRMGHTGDEDMNASEAVILNVLRGVPDSIPATKLVKLVYLVDYVHFQHFGKAITGFQYIWDQYGPNAVGHAIISEAEELVLKGMAEYAERPDSCSETTKYFGVTPGGDVPPLPPEARMALDDVLHQYGSLSVDDITGESKKTAPFQKASEYELLELEHSFPALTTTAEDWRAYQSDLEEYGTLSLEQIKERYALE